VVTLVIEYPDATFSDPTGSSTAWLANHQIDSDMRSHWLELGITFFNLPAPENSRIDCKEYPTEKPNI
jgi:hypothetical protein